VAAKVQLVQRGAGEGPRAAALCAVELAAIPPLAVLDTDCTELRGTR